MNNGNRDIETLPAIVQVTVQTHISMLQAALSGWLESYYIIGSVALGAFTQGHSDVDFVAVTTARLTAADLEKLKRIHAELWNKRLFTGLDGLYITDEDMGGTSGSITGCARFNEGKFHGLQRFDASSIDALELKQVGIRILGRDPAALPFTVDWNKLLAGMVNNVNTYWRRWAQRCSMPFSLNYAGLYFKHGAVEWGVLGISRIYFTLRERDVASKSAAGRYVLGTVPEKWHRVINEALRLRNAEIAPQYKSIIRRRNEALAYIGYMIEECEKW